MRWYLIRACRSASGEWMPHTEWAEKIVSGVGVADAFDNVRRLGWWPVSIRASSWDRRELDEIQAAE